MEVILVLDLAAEAGVGKACTIPEIVRVCSLGLMRDQCIPDLSLLNMTSSKHFIYYMLHVMMHAKFCNLQDTLYMINVYTITYCFIYETLNILQV